MDYLVFFLDLILIDFFFFFNDTATTEIYTLSLHDALPIGHRGCGQRAVYEQQAVDRVLVGRSEEHTSELQSLAYLVCRLLLEKKKIEERYDHSAGPARHVISSTAVHRCD